MSFCSVNIVYILDLVGKMLMKVWFIKKVHNNRQKHWNGVDKQ
jgi:hypothetical protein